MAPQPCPPSPQSTRGRAHRAGRPLGRPLAPRTTRTSGDEPQPPLEHTSSPLRGKRPGASPPAGAAAPAHDLAFPVRVAVTHRRLARRGTLFMATAPRAQAAKTRVVGLQVSQGN